MFDGDMEYVVLKVFLSSMRALENAVRAFSAPFFLENLKIIREIC